MHGKTTLPRHLLVGLTHDLIATADSFEMARAFVHRALLAMKFDSAELIWPDDRLGRALRTEHVGRKPSAKTHKIFSVRFRDHGSIFFRVDFYSARLKKLSTATQKELRGAALLVERAITENETRLQREELNRFQWIRQFAAGLSHEINTPLTTLLFYARKLQKADAPSGHADHIQQSVASLTAILDRYRQLTGDGEFLQFKMFTALELSERLRAHLQNEFPEWKNALHFHLPKPTAQVSVRPADIERLMVALVNNAIDAVRRRQLRQPEVTAEIHVEFALRSEAFEVLITDNGIGISPDDRAFVFAPFFTTKEVNEGMGLGLSLARAIAFAHEGTLRLNSLSEKTQFIFQIPLAQAEKLKESA